jgi:hypothetical protein
MKKLISVGAEFGPFQSIVMVDDQYLADGVCLPVSALPGEHVIVDVEDLPQPWVSGAYTIQGGALILDEESAPWQAYLQAEAARLDKAKSERLADINRWRADANATIFPFAGKHIQCDALSTTDILGTALSIALTGAFPPDFPGAWKASDNTYIPLPTVEDFAPLYSAFTQRGSLNFQRAQELKAQVASATTFAELEEVKW